MMKAALWILLVLAVIGVGVFIHQTNQAEKTRFETPTGDDSVPGMGPKEVDFPSISPPATPEFECSIEPSIEDGVDAVYITVRETHGWYADLVQLQFWHQTIDENGYPTRDSLIIPYLLPRPIPLNESVTVRVVPRQEELRLIWKKEDPKIDFGTEENWDCVVVACPYVRAPKPE